MQEVAQEELLVLVVLVVVAMDQLHLALLLPTIPLVKQIQVVVAVELGVAQEPLVRLVALVL
jgi:hypothetical protein